jgi:hypothetical protein
MSKFDWIFYTTYYDDLKKGRINTEQKAYNHWINYGKSENRVCNKIELEEFNNKKQLLKNMIDSDKDKSVVESTTEPTEPTEPTKPTEPTELVAELVTEPTEPVDEPITEPVDEPVTEPVTEPVDEPVAEPTVTKKSRKKKSSLNVN